MAAKSRSDKDLSELKDSFQSLKAQLGDQTDLNKTLDKLISALRSDSARYANELNHLSAINKELDAKTEQLNKANEKILLESANENTKLAQKLKEQENALKERNQELEKKDSELERKEQNLNNLNAELKQKIAFNDSLKAEYQKLMGNLNASEQKIAEMQTMLSRKDSLEKSLMNTLNKALGGFTAAGLNVSRKNGKVYVSLSEQLLFASGSTTVETRGKQALKELAKVLENNTDLNITIEGHTDDVPLVGSGNLKDNWDLSVLRGTSVQRILTENTKLDPARITVAGRSQYLPLDVAKTAEARKKNRRTEIILTPKLDELQTLLQK